MPERASVNQKIQIGTESTPGTNVAASKVIESFDFVMGVKPDAKTYRATGRRWPSVQEENREWTEVDITGNLDYQGMVYLVSGPWGAATISTHTGGTLSKDWVWTPPITGSITPKTYTIEQGDAVRAHKVNYGLITGFGYKGSRADFTCDAKAVAQALQDGITMTASPSIVALSPVVGKHVNIYIDSTSGGLGTTQYTRFLEVDYKYESGFGTFWPLNRANASFTGHVDTVPKNTVKVLLEADSQGMGLLTNLQNGSTLYLRVDMVGTIIENAITYALQHDMACKIINMDKFTDKEGLFAVGYEMEIVEDAAWSSGQSQKLTITNQLTGL
jgi:hypothetical protein